MPDLRRAIAENFPDSRYIHGEFITGLDGKQRLLRPLRVEQFRFLADALRRGGLDREIYLSLSPLAWEAWRAPYSSSLPTVIDSIPPHDH